MLSGSDVLSANPADINTDQLQSELEQFLATYPPPSDQDIQTLHELTEAIDSQWIKDNALFAYNRVTEVKERFGYYRKRLSELVAEKRRREEEKEREREREEREQGGGEGGKEVRIAANLLTQLSIEGEEEPDGVLLENKAIETTPPGVSGVKLRHPKGASNSLMYDDTGG